ncbi:ABC transporter permease [Rhizocola hellebori]|uniref:Xylose transport system permease protein XylH n=1 Tax=Rhizocola hellebori TaxID=1392758 RepID=A0A8J3QFF5_9ACTN|nr:ABC transporter permease [Rhizocola hellebori]GIH08617.1 ABC transporter permease [Rhizocola hellebori]
MNEWLASIRKGNLGALPAVAGLIVLCVVFSVMRPVFFTAGNFANLFTQAAQVSLIAMGLVFVLLLGEIDLSAGFTSGVCAAVLAVTMDQQGFPWYVSMGLAIVTGSVIGLVLGFLVAKAGIPSFVVTLAAFLAFQGVVLLVVKAGNIVPIRDPIIIAVATKNLTPLLGWVFFGIAVVGYAAVQVRSTISRRKQGVTADSWNTVLLRVGAVAVLLGIMVAVLNQERSRNALIVSLKGVPIVVPVIAFFLVLGTFLLGRTAYGRHLYAVGGNSEASRRAGINVDWIRMSAFVICSTMAAVGGIVAASRNASVDPNTGGSNVLLYAVGAAVIGGTSLFGGKGRVLDAVLGGLVVAVIDNGMGLMGYTAGVKYVVTGTVLLLAASVDALSRKRASVST